jgi:predicted RNA-binding Zn-ribbon protein involved in translation (DUF1610 family)
MPTKTTPVGEASICPECGEEMNYGTLSSAGDGDLYQDEWCPKCMIGFRRYIIPPIEDDLIFGEERVRLNKQEVLNLSLEQYESDLKLKHNKAKGEPFS